MSKYHREIKPSVSIDVYDILRAYKVTCPARQHAIKKLLMPGQRGTKKSKQDLVEAHESIARAIAMECEEFK